MINFRKLIVLVAAVAALAACARTAPSAAGTAADEAAVRAVNTAWFKGYSTGDGAAVAALYAEDAVLSAPGVPAARGNAAIREFYVKDVASYVAAGLRNAEGAASDVGVSGDLAWQWGTYQVTDKSGAVVEAGKFLTVFQRQGGKWMIIRDTWNSDAEPAAAAPAAAAVPK
jgi:uncharacterized protein (TIGR02246 family)